MTLYSLVSDFSFSKDFCAYWSSVHLYSQGADFYNLKVLNEYQSVHCGIRTGPVFYPPWLLILLAPLLLFSFPQALVVWILFQIGLLFFLMHVLQQAFPSKRWALVLLLSFVPLLYTIKFGQLSLFLTCLLYKAILLLRDKKYSSAGIVYALTTLKPHLSWLLWIYLLFQSDVDRRRFWLSYFGALLVLVLPFLVMDSDLFLRWQGSLEGAIDWRTPTLYGVFSPFFSNALFLKAGILIAGSAFVWYVSRRKLSSLSPELFFMQSVLLCLGSVFLSPYGWIFDYTVACALPLFLYARMSRRYVGLYLAATAIAYLQSSVLVDMGAYQIAWYPVVLLFLGWMIIRDSRPSTEGRV